MHRLGTDSARRAFLAPGTTVSALALTLTLCLSACSTTDGANGGPSDAGAVDSTATDSATTDTGLPANRTVFINEVVAKAVPDAKYNPTASDWVELYNSSSEKVDLAGWRIIDSKSKPFAEAIALPPATTIPAKGYLLIYFNKDGAGSPTIPKGLSATEALSLFSADGVLQDLVDWKDGDAPEGKSWGRTPDGSEITKTFDTPTPNAANP